MTDIATDPDDLVARFVTSGMHVHLAMTTARANAATLALARCFAGTHSLTVSMAAVYSAAHALALSGAVDRMITCFLGDTCPTPRPNVLYRDLARGQPFEVELWSVLTFVQRLIAGGMGLPYAVINSLRGSDLIQGKEDTLFSMPDPSGGQPLLLAKALHPDITIVHGLCADSRGNVALAAPLGEGPWSSYAATHGVLATVERIVPDEVIDRNPDRVVIPGQRVIAMCEAHLGAHPQSLRSDGTGGVAGYIDDYRFLEEIARCGRSADAMRQWYQEWVVDTGSHAGYLAKLNRATQVKLPLHVTGTPPATVSDHRLAIPTQRDVVLMQSADPQPPSAGFGGSGGAARTVEPTPHSVMVDSGRRTAQVATVAAVVPVQTRVKATAKPTELEQAIVLAARSIEHRVLTGGYDTLLAGIGPSHLATWLAAGRLREQGTEVKVCAELGFYGQRPTPGDVFLFSLMHESEQLAGIPEVLGGMVAGNQRCMGVLSAAEVDVMGNINTCLLPDGRWITGSGGANDIASAVDCVVVATASPRRYVPAVTHVTSPGANVREVVSQFGRFQRLPGEPFHLATWLPNGHPTCQDAVAALTGWPCSADLVSVEAEVCVSELGALRRLDPQGYYR